LRRLFNPRKNAFDLTDSLSSVKALLSRKISHRTHPLVYECKQMCSNLVEDGIEVGIIWIPAHVGLEGNEIVDEWARHAALNGAVFGKICFAKRVAGYCEH
jgi:ribonuclease HI